MRKKIVKTTISICIISIVTIILIFLLSQKSSAARDDAAKHDSLDYNKNTNKYAFCINDLIRYNNLYCIEHGEYMNENAYKWDPPFVITLDGNTITWKDGTDLKTDSREENNVLGAILCEKKQLIKSGNTWDWREDNDYVWGYGYQSQYALWSYLAEWNSIYNFIDPVEYWKNPFPNWDDRETLRTKFGLNSNSEVEVRAFLEVMKAKYKEIAKTYKYKAKIYIYRAYGRQNVLLVERGETTKKSVDVTVEKQWNDGDNKYNTRPEIEVKLLENDADIGKRITLNQNNGWKGTFTELKEDVTYTVQEVNPPEGYRSEIIQNGNNYSFKIVNTLKTQVNVVKKWDDKDNIAETRPSSLNITLYVNGNPTITKTLNAENGWRAEFSNLDKYDAYGNEIVYGISESSIDNKYALIANNKTVDENGNIIITLNNKYEPKYDGYIEIEGKVWLDKPDVKANVINGTLDSDESGIEGIKVVLKDSKGYQFDATSYTTTRADGSYTIKVNYDNSQKVYKLYENAETVKTKLNTAYIEFEYDGLKYTTVATSNTGADKSRGIEDETRRSAIDGTFTRVTSGTKTLSEVSYDERKITASTKNVITSFNNYKAIAGNAGSRTETATIKYCYGNGKYVRTESEQNWKVITGNHTCPNCQGSGHILRTFDVTVEKIQNVNLGLFLREQPDVALFTDISKVEVEMNKQKYTYVYGVRNDKLEAEGGLKTKFQNKDTYTYRRPVNPADIAYLKTVNKNAMEVYVTYQISIANLSNTLTTIVDSITNYYDSKYVISDITYGTINTTNGLISGIPLNTSTNSINHEKYNEITLSNLGMEVNGLEESANKIFIRYKIDQTKLPELFDDNTPPLNNASEITAYTTKYGTETLYAEQETGKRTGNPYAGYDYKSHPGNAGIFINGDGRLEATQKENDTDIAPTFVLCQDDVKTLSGTLWEDNGELVDGFRLGDGKKSDSEKTVKNVKVELYKVNNDGSTVLANLYNKDGSTKPAVTYSNNVGYYSFGNNEDGYSVVTDTYLIKFIYGTEIDGTISSTISDIAISGRDYKSTIINKNTELYNLFKNISEDDQWHLKIDKGYSIAVDNIEERIKIKDLQYSNFDDGIYMTAYSKPFEMQVEFDSNTQKTSKVLDENGKVAFGNELNVFDFGIVERAREDIYVQKTINYIKITLANGQELIEGNPVENHLNYVKAIGYKQKITNGREALQALEKQMLIEIDAELMQGAQLEIKYAINVVNNSEKDIDYQEKDINGKYKTEFYNFGTNEIDKGSIIKSSVYLADYVDTDIKYSWENEGDWLKINPKNTSSGFKWNELINKETIEIIKNGKYNAYLTTKFSELEPGDTSETIYATASKLLTDSEENIYENHIEILRINAKTARTMEGKKDDGTPETRRSKPGNYVPSQTKRFVSDDVSKNLPGKHEKDDDVAKIVITPPTGGINYEIIYSITILSGLILIAIGIVIIKRKILNN